MAFHTTACDTHTHIEKKRIYCNIVTMLQIIPWYKISLLDLRVDQIELRGKEQQLYKQDNDYYFWPFCGRNWTKLKQFLYKASRRSMKTGCWTLPVCVHLRQQLHFQTQYFWRQLNPIQFKKMFLKTSNVWCNAGWYARWRLWISPISSIARCCCTAASH